MKKNALIRLILLAAILLPGTLVPAFSQDPELSFQKGLIKEEGEGSLDEAIILYLQVAEDESAERSLRAQALLRAGICYEKQGKENASKTYRKLITEFSDQEEVVAMGRQNLARLEPALTSATPKGLVVEELGSFHDDTYDVSPDGRYYTYIDWSQIQLRVRDLHTEETWGITPRGTWKPPMRFPDNSSWSPDGKQVAHFYYVGDTTELHLVNRDGSNDRILIRDKGNRTPWPEFWSPDGKYLLAFRSSEDNEDYANQVVLVTVSTGDVRVLHTMENVQPACCGSISPDGSYAALAIQQDEASQNNDIFLLSLNEPDRGLVRIVDNPGNDKNPIWTPDGSGIIFRSDRSGTTDLWSQKLRSGTPEGLPERLMSNLGKGWLFRTGTDQSLYYSSSADRSDIYLAEFDPENGAVLSPARRISDLDNITNVKPTWSADGRFVVYNIHPEHRDNIYGYQYIYVIYDTQSGQSRTLETGLWGGILNYWDMPRFSPDGKQLIVHGISREDDLQGFFLVDTEDGSFEALKVEQRQARTEADRVGAFPEFSKDGRSLYYLSWDKKNLIRRELENGAEDTIYASPHEWLYYKFSQQGDRIAFGHFFDHRNALFTIPGSGGEKTLIAEFEEGITPYIMDWSLDDQYILIHPGWYKSELEHEIWRVPVAGGDPEKLTTMKDIIAERSVNSIHVHPDGHHLVFSAHIGEITHIWAVKNLFVTDH